MYLPVGQINWKDILNRIKWRHMNYRPKFWVWHLPSCEAIKALSCLQNARACGLQREACRHHQNVIHKALPAWDWKQHRQKLQWASRRSWSKVRRGKKMPLGSLSQFESMFEVVVKGRGSLTHPCGSDRAVAGRQIGVLACSSSFLSQLAVD